MCLAVICVSLYTEYSPDLHKKFQVASSYDSNVAYQIWNFCWHLFCSYADNRYIHTHRLTNRYKCGFQIQWPSKHIQGLIIARACWAYAQGPLTNFRGFRAEIAIKWKIFFIKMVKTAGKNVFPNVLKILKWDITY